MSEQNLENFARIKPQVQRVQNYLIILVDDSIDLTKEDFQNSIAKLHSVVNKIITCTTVNECCEYLDTLDEGKAFIMSTGALGRSLVTAIHDIPTVDAIYIFCNNKSRHER